MSDNPKGSIMVWKSDLFYEPDEVKRTDNGEKIAKPIVDEIDEYKRW